MKALSVLLAACLFLAACTPNPPTKIDETPDGPPPAWFTAALPDAERPACAGKTFTPGDLIALGASGNDFRASLATYGGSLAGVTLIVTVADADMQLSASILPGPGKMVDLGWGSYVSVRVMNCFGKYRYQAAPLGAVHRPGPSVCSFGYTEGLKPYPFLDSTTVFESGDEQVILATNSSPQGALIHTIGLGTPEVTTFDRGDNGPTSVKTLAIRGGRLQVSVKTCGVSFFYNAAVLSDRR